MSRLALAIVAIALSLPALALDHSHKAWEALLAKHVRYLPGGNASQVAYAGFMKDRAALKRVLDEYERVTHAEFDGWSKAEQQAFLINAYNAFTIEKILRRYPDIESIRDYGTLFGNPWKDRFFKLFGEPAHLDLIEHDILRREGAYDEPRVHVAVVCASVGCPMLRNEAFVAARLEAQLEDAMRRFLSDRSRNRYNPQSGRLEVSRIFDWYGKDFEQGHSGYDSLKTVFARHADQLADSADDRARIRAGAYRLDFLSYDWALNDVR